MCVFLCIFFTSLIKTSLNDLVLDVNLSMGLLNIYLIQILRSHILSDIKFTKISTLNYMGLLINTLSRLI